LNETTGPRLFELVDSIARQPQFAALIAGLRAGGTVSVDGVWGASRGLVVAALSRRADGPVVAVCPCAAEMDTLADDAALFTDATVSRFPAWESEPGEQVMHDDIYADRLRLIKRLRSADRPRIVVTSIQSLLQPVPAESSWVDQSRRIRLDEEIDPRELARWLVERGFHSTSGVELPGEFSLRGGIIDLFAPDWLEPVRVEFLGDQVESLRRFSVSTQRSLAELEEIEVTLIKPSRKDRAHLVDYLPSGSWLLLVEPGLLEEEGRNYLQRLERAQDFHSTRATFARLATFPNILAENVAGGPEETSWSLPIESVERFSGQVGEVRAELESACAGHQVFVVCETQAEVQRLDEVLGTSRPAAAGSLQFVVGRLSQGFRLVSERVVLVSGAELFRRRDVARTTRRPLGRAIDSFLALRDGDLVVHLAHGIGRYRGLVLLEGRRQVEEHLALEFHGGTKIFVPASKIDLVQKYVGGSKHRPALARIGGRAWGRQKAAAEQAALDLAAEMIDLEAARAGRRGIRFPTDSAWQQEFDASFPYRETPDQIAAMAEIRRDMQAARPMDRLLCGDVGFGKTELAIRAAFKAVDAGYQVAVLVPTTILAEQHRRTFGDRMAEFPIQSAALSRFCTRKQQQEIIDGLACGGIDIVIGTHRLAGRDLKFHNLGLVIIDEEQRFGVAIKQRLRSFRKKVDVLTMTATPIPRTLHMSLLGVRSISNLQTAPEDRYAVQTRVSRWSEPLVRHAVLREINRGGQIFFVHNRVQDIEALADRLRRTVPEARIEVGHGQMPEGQLEDVMLRFMNGGFDLLLATTIVESGLDIPNANTIFIDDADRYGLADLHQLRGRVGRYKHRAYCYLLIDQKRHLTPEAARRLRAIEEFSELGSGFAIATRDLELRGAGNILGTQQSGHIANVGYELYCSLLDRAVRGLRQVPVEESIDASVELPGPVYLPADYVPDMRTKIDLYRRLLRIGSEDRLADLQAELVDRFGPLPDPVQRLLVLAKMRIWAHRCQIESIHVEDGYVVLRARPPAGIGPLVASSGTGLRQVDDQTAYLPVGNEVARSQRVWAAVESVLRPA